MSYTVEDFKEKFKQNTDNFDDPNDVTLEGIGTLKVVHEWGGEGEGTSIGYVVQVENRYFRISGIYDSWEGTEWSWADFDEVEPYQKTITDWKKI